MGLFEYNKLCLAHAGFGTSRYIQIAGLKIPRLFIILATFSSSMLGCVLEGAVCMKFLEYGLAEFLGPFGFLLSFSSVSLIYISLVVKSKEISELFDYLENVINASKCRILEIKWGSKQKSKWDNYTPFEWLESMSGYIICVLFLKERPMDHSPFIRRASQAPTKLFKRYFFSPIWLASLFM